MARKGFACPESHKALKLPGSDKVIYGGSCLNPVIKDADVYIGFDSDMQATSRSYPWTPGHEVMFSIRDMDAPKDHEQFAKLVNWVREQLEAGAKVHCGCIGGHGRTGLFLAALCSTYGEADPIAYVRSHYCSSAVESAAQIKFLVDHWDAAPANPAKHFDDAFEVAGSRSGRFNDAWDWDSGWSRPRRSAALKEVKRNTVSTYQAVRGRNSIWGV